MGSQGYDNISVMNDKCIGDTLQLDDNVYRITNVETGYLEDEEEEWPYSVVCYIATTANEDKVISWFGKAGFPSEINIIDINKNPIKYLPPVKQGNTVISS